MRRCTWKLLVVIGTLCAAGLASPTNARAGVFSDTWWFLFGPPGTTFSPGAYGTYYGGGFTSYYGGGYTSNYGGSAYASRTYRVSYGQSCCQPVQTYYPSAACCQPCDPCANPCTPCGAGGPCQISDGGGAPKTFRQEDGRPPTPMKDDNFKSRDNGKSKFKPTREEKKENPGFGPNGSNDGQGGDGQGGDGTGPIKRDALKPPLPKKEEYGDEDDKAKSGPAIRKKKPAPAKPPVGPSEGENEKTVELPVEPANLDGAITWRTPVRRTRLIIRPTLPTQSVVRSTVPLNEGWRPLRKTETKVVAK